MCVCQRERERVMTFQGINQIPLQHYILLTFTLHLPDVFIRSLGIKPTVLEMCGNPTHDLGIGLLNMGENKPSMVEGLER